MAKQKEVWSAAGLVSGVLLLIYPYVFFATFLKKVAQKSPLYKNSVKFYALPSWPPKTRPAELKAGLKQLGSKT
ncbi:MAG TPA: hypothetical protein PLR18_04035 [bacterium]|nr:hypothetical protein [bacterium]